MLLLLEASLPDPAATMSHEVQRWCALDRDPEIRSGHASVTRGQESKLTRGFKRADDTLGLSGERWRNYDGVNGVTTATSEPPVVNW